MTGKRGWNQRNVYEGFQKKEQTLTMAVDLEDAYNKVQIKLLMELIVQYGVSLTLTIWLAPALQDRKVAMRLGNWISTPQQLTMELPQAPSPPPPPLFPVLYNVYTKGLADLNTNTLSRMLTHDGLIYKTASDIHTAVTAVQEQLEKVSHWFQETESEINPSKAQAPWCTLNNKAVGQAMPAISFNGEVIERMNNLRYLGIHFDRMLTYKTQVESTKLRCKKGLNGLKVMASKGIEQRHLFLLYRSVILNVIDYGLGLTTLSQSNLLKLNRVQNEAMTVIFWEKQRTHPLRPCATYLTCHPWKQDLRWSKSKRFSMRCRIPRIHSMMLSKKKRGVDGQDASHGWAEQSNQSSKCAVSQNSSK